MCLWSLAAFTSIDYSVWLNLSSRPLDCMKGRMKLTMLYVCMHTRGVIKFYLMFNLLAISAFSWFINSAPLSVVRISGRPILMHYWYMCTWANYLIQCFAHFICFCCGNRYCLHPLWKIFTRSQNIPALRFKSLAHYHTNFLMKKLVTKGQSNQ